jgi:hypothetical protein
LRHFRRRKLALVALPSVAPALRPSRVQARSAVGLLVGAAGPALGLAALLGGARGPAEHLAALAARTDPQLAPAAAAQPQAPGFLGGHGDAENEHFLDSTDETSDTAPRRRLVSRQRLPAGLGVQPGPCTFLGGPSLPEQQSRQQLCGGDHGRGIPAFARGLSQIHALSGRR